MGAGKGLLLLVSLPATPLLAQAAMAQGPGTEAAATQRPNIVYIMTDDHTAQMMSCYDRRYVETPNLDHIAADGVRFTRR